MEFEDAGRTRGHTPGGNLKLPAHLSAIAYPQVFFGALRAATWGTFVTNFVLHLEAA